MVNKAVKEVGKLVRPVEALQSSPKPQNPKTPKPHAAVSLSLVSYFIIHLISLNVTFGSYLGPSAKVTGKCQKIQVHHLLFQSGSVRSKICPLPFS